MSRISLIPFVIFMCSVTNGKELGHISEKLIIDNDAGGDDAVAILLAILNEKYFNGPKVIGLTTVKGNTKESNVNINNQRILKLAQRQDIPIYRGSKDSLLNEFDSGTYFGVDGLGDTGEELTGLLAAQQRNAVSALIELSIIHENKLSVITLGPLTNIAMAIRLDPNFIGRLAQLYIGAGHIHSKLYQTAEFNAHFDVEAYHIVIENANPDKVTILPFSQVGTYLNISKDWRVELLGAIDNDIVRTINKYEQVTLKRVECCWVDLDPAVAAVAFRPDLVKEYKYSKNDIILNGNERGIVTNKFVNKDEATTRIINILKQDDYQQFLLSVFSAVK